MSDKRNPDSPDESEFGLGTGMIDSVQRADGRDAMPLHQQLWEIYAKPKTFDGSGGALADVETTPVPRLLPGETEADRG